MTALGELTLEDAAKEAAGNWQCWTCFVWDRERDLDDPDNWAIVYTHNRDSGLLAQSNADAINKAMEPFTDTDDPDVIFESHDHWACGHVDGFSIRVNRCGQITDAFKTYHEITEQLADYPILDEGDYSEREFEATIENINDAAWRVKDEFTLPEGWESEVYSWLSDHRSGSVENTDDQGGYPEQDDLREAFDALGYIQHEE
jgi:hypothetical protein